MNSVYLIAVAFSVVNIAAGKPLRKQMNMYHEFQLCEGKLNDMVANICNIYRLHPESLYNVDEEAHEPTMVIYDGEKNFSMTNLCCYNKCVVQDVIMHFCHDQSPYQVIQPIKSEEYPDMDLEFDISESITDIP